MFTATRLPLLVVGLIGLLAACSATAGGPGVATLDEPGASASSAPADAAASTAPSDPQEAFLAYAQCMRDHGIDMPDPEMVPVEGEGPGGVAFKVGVDGGATLDKEDFRAADTACHHFLANVVGDKAGGGLSPEDEDRLLQFARCMREHGIDMPDPQTGGGMIIDEEQGDGSRIDPNSAEFQAAQEACGSLLPGKIQGGGPGGGTGPGSGTVKGGVAVPAGPPQ
jgi:hypothetical protein